MKLAALLAGIVMLVAGLLFMAQGSASVTWPSSSFMIGETQWVYYGGIIAILGILLITVVRRVL
jgi:hypothetical protein